MTKPVIVFVFAGREPNMRLQLPLIRRILALHSNVEYHVWNMTHCESDDAFVRSIEGDRITVINDLVDREDFEQFSLAYKFYDTMKYRKHLFVKIDDDIVFLQTDRFGDFVEQIEKHPDTVLCAHIMNNGACAMINGVWDEMHAFQQARRDPSWDIEPSDVHTSNKFAVISHEFAFRNIEALLAEPVEVVPVTDWLSINVVGYSYDLAGEMNARGLGKIRPRMRQFDPEAPLGDEGVMNLFPRAVVKGCLAAHLSFGSQHVTDQQYDEWRECYQELAVPYV
jgi:hypothetical protein